MRSTQIALSAMLIVMAIAGAVLTLGLSRSTEHWALWVFRVLFLVGIFSWYVCDSNSRGFPRSRWLNVGVILLSLLALPYYLFASRGTKGGFVALGKCLAFVVLLLAASMLGGLASGLFVAA